MLQRIRNWLSKPTVREEHILAALTRLERRQWTALSILTTINSKVNKMTQIVQDIETTVDDIADALADAKLENAEVKATLQTLAETIVAIRADLPTQDVKDALVRVQQKATKVLDDLRAETAALKVAEDAADDPITPAEPPVATLPVETPPAVEGAPAADQPAPDADAPAADQPSTDAPAAQ